MPTCFHTGSNASRKLVPRFGPEQAWRPRIIVLPPSPLRRVASRPDYLTCPHGRPVAWRAIVPRTAHFSLMKTISACSRPSHRAFTLVELLVVISIIGILAGLLLPALVRGKIQAQTKRAQMEIGNIVAAVNQYESTYSRLPVSSNALNAAVAAGGEDFTYGGVFASPATPVTVVVPGVRYTADNREVMAILLDLENYSDGTPTINRGHVKNPQRIKFLNATTVGDTKSPGVGADGVYRDPWGNPYVITLDLNYDERCRDAFYRTPAVSQSAPSSPTGLNGLYNSADNQGNGPHFELPNTKVMVWSAGYDKKIDPTRKANQGVNRDNVLSWKQ